jgi:hypothetical protein
MYGRGPLSQADPFRIFRMTLPQFSRREKAA